MALLTFIRFARGYRGFSVRGGRPERFINLCTRAGIPLWRQEREHGVFRAETTLASARLLPDIAARSGVELTLGAARGLPALFGRYRRRTGLFIGAALMIAALAAMGRFIWTVEVVGLETIPEAEVYAALSELGVKKGALRSSIEVRETERRLLLRFDALSFAAVNISGTSATVELCERTLPPETVDDDSPYNVIASRDGFITRMEVYTGAPAVQPGASVSRGDVLISGVVDNSKGDSRYLHARGVVTAQTAEHLQVEVKYEREILIPQGEESRRYLSIMGVRLPLWFYSELETPHRESETQRELWLLSRLSGAMLIEETVTFYRTHTLTLQESEALAIAQRELARLEAEQLAGFEIISRVETGQELTDSFRLWCDYICEGNIAVESEIFIENS